MSEYAAIGVGFAEESTPGVVPTNPVFRRVQITDDTLDSTTRGIENNQLRTDLQDTGITPGGQELGGGINTNASWDNLRDPLRGVFGANVAVYPVREKTATAANIGAVGATGYAVLASAGTDENTGTPVQGHLVLATGFGVAANNGLKLIGAGSTATLWAVTGLTTEATPPVGAMLKVVGLEFPIGDLAAAGPSGGYAGFLTSATFPLPFVGLQPGDQLKLGGTAAGTKFATTPANNGVAIVGGPITTNSIPLSEVPTGWGVDSGAGQTIRMWLGDSLTNGVLLKTFSAEEEQSDLGEFTVSPGTLIRSIAYTIPEGEKITANVTMIGFGSNDATTVRTTGASTKAAPTGDVLNGANNLATERINGVTVSAAYVTSTTFTYLRDNALRGAHGSYSKTGARAGTFRVDGGFDMYYEATSGRAVKAQTKAGTAFSYSAFLVDPTAPNGARAESHYIPRAQYTAAPRQNTNGFRGLRPTWRGSVHATLGFTARYQRWAYLEL